MPPSRGLRPVGHLLSQIGRSPIGARTGVRTLSSASLSARYGARARTVVPSSSLSVTGYILHNGRANLSLWPFSIPKPADAPPEETLPLKESAASSSPPEAISSAASNAPDATSSIASQASSTLHDAASTVSSTVDSALDPVNAADAPPAFLENITQIGQLKEIGLDFGWGPTSMVEWVVEHVHVYAGTPWYGTVILSAIAMRILMVYPFYRMSNEQAKMNRIQPELRPLMDEAKRAQLEGDRMAQQIAGKRMQILKKRHGINLGWTFAPIFLQGFFGFGAYKLFRNMGDLPVPGFETGGFGWITNLAVADPTYILPVALFGTMHLLARVAQADSTSADPAVAKMMKPLGLYVFPALMFLVAFWQCAALQLSFFVATLWGTLQNLVFRNASFRSAVGMEPLTAKRPLNLSQSAPSSGTSGGSAGAVPSVPASTENPFKNNPFANLNLARKPGAANESGLRYQAPTAAHTLRAAKSAINQPQSDGQEGPEVPKEDSFLSRELKNAKAGLGTFMDGARDKARSYQNNQKSRGDRGRDPSYVIRNRQYEEKKRRERERAGIK